MMNTEDCQKLVTRDFLESKLSLLKSELNLQREQQITEIWKLISVIIVTVSLTASLTSAILINVLRP